MNPLADTRVILSVTGFTSRRGKGGLGGAGSTGYPGGRCDGGNIYRYGNSPLRNGDHLRGWARVVEGIQSERDVAMAAMVIHTGVILSVTGIGCDAAVKAACTR